jgi:type VII secretion integral membrane protein EccD
VSIQQELDCAPSGSPATHSPRVAVGVLAGRTKIGVVLDAAAPISVQLSPLLRLINGRLRELGEPALVAGERGRWALCEVDGTALKPGRSLADQGVVDGGRLVLRFVPDGEARVNVVEHVTTAMAVELAKRWTGVTPEWAGRVGAGMVIAGVLTLTGFMAAWRYGHCGWLAGPCCLGLAAAVITTAVVILARVTTDSARRIGDLLLLTGTVPAAVGAAAVVPGPVGAAHTALGSAAMVAAALLIVRFTGRHIALGTTVLVTAAAGIVVGLARMWLLTSAVTLLTVLLLSAVLGVHVAPTFARWAASIRLPVFPSASGRWIFETRPELPKAVVVASGELATLDGPESVRDIAVCTDRIHAYLTGLLCGACAVVVVCCVGLCDPLRPQRWLPLMVAGLVAVAVLLRGRSYADRWQATILAVAAVAIPTGVAGRYIGQLWTPEALLVGVGVIVAVPVAGLVAAVVVPNRFFTPPFRKIVEWVEYLCLTGIFPLAFWLMGVFAAIRYR